MTRLKNGLLIRAVKNGPAVPTAGGDVTVGGCTCTVLSFLKIAEWCGCSFRKNGFELGELGKTNLKLTFAE